MTPYEARRSHSRSQRQCIGFRETLELQRERKAAARGDRPQPWILQKLTIGIVVCLVGYTVYVYVARFCVPMIRKEDGSMGGRAMGIGFLVGFSLLFLMFGWAYLKVVFTPPGYAKDYVSKTTPPVPAQQPSYQPNAWNSDESVAGSPYNSATSNSRSRRSLDIPSFSNSQSSPQTRSPAHSRRNTYETNMNMMQVRPSQPSGSSETSPSDVIPAVPASRTASRSGPRKPPASQTVPDGNGSGSGLPPPLYSRRPPTHPTLSPEYRYCNRDGLVKPMRVHHCRACGTCVLKYDHHCPWIGQCVGAFNHKFFVNFLQWSTLFTLFTFATLVGLNARASASGSISASIDPQHIVIIALSGIFTIFTLVLFISHVHLILLNASTVEHLGMQRMRERERNVLSHMTSCPWPCSSESSQPPEAYGLLEGGGRSPCCKFLTMRRRILKQWDAEWGKIDTEGNIWWLGSRRANWEATMGKGKLGWILPIGRSIGDGLTYPTNPRFDREGRWRRRVEWPEGLR